MLGEYYLVEILYLDNDGKKYGMAEMDLQIKNFQGVKKITSLPVYPLKYHPNSDEMKARLVERGKKFAGMSGMHYKNHQGMAYFKVRKPPARAHIGIR